MSHWRERLRDADAALTSALRPEDAQRLRRSVLVAASAAPSRRWPLPFALTAGSLAVASAALVLSAAIAAPERPANENENGDRTTAAQEPAPETPLADSGRRQLHFATPGGTRIIWVFDAEFEVKGTLP